MAARQSLPPLDIGRPARQKRRQVLLRVETDIEGFGRHGGSPFHVFTWCIQEYVDNGFVVIEPLAAHFEFVRAMLAQPTADLFG